MALIHEYVTLAASWIDDWPYRPTRVFPACFVLTRTLLGKTSQEVTHPEIAPSQARLTVEFFRDGLPKNKMHLVDIGSTNQSI